MKIKFKIPTIKKKDLKSDLKNSKFPFRIKKIEKPNKKRFRLFAKKSETNIINSLKNLFKK